MNTRGVRCLLGQKGNSGLDRRTEAKNREKESTMISKTFRIARMIVLASFALSSAAWAATCSTTSLSDMSA